MRVAIIGCGLIGRKGASAVGAEETLVACCDTNVEAALRLAGEFSCEPFDDYHALLCDTETEAVIVSVVNKFSREIVINALACGKHVLVEKPLGRNVREAAGWRRMHQPAAVLQQVKRLPRGTGSPAG